jgi:hypothetical protein
MKNEGDRDNSLPIWPYINQPLPEGSLDMVLARIVDPTVTVGDMDLTQLVRVLYLSDATQQAAIQTRLQALYDSGQLRFWLQQGETHSTYWTEVLLNTLTTTCRSYDNNPFVSSLTQPIVYLFLPLFSESHDHVALVHATSTTVADLSLGRRCNRWIAAPAAPLFGREDRVRLV